MQENNLKLEFKNFVTELSTEIAKQILNEDIKKFTDEHSVNINKYKNIFIKLEEINKEFNTTSMKMSESKEVFEGYNKKIDENSKYINSAIKELEIWKNDIKKEIIDDYEKALEKNLEVIKETNERFCNNIVEVLNNELEKQREMQKNQLIQLLKALRVASIKDVAQEVGVLRSDVSFLKLKVNSIQECQINTTKDMKIISQVIVRNQYK